MRHAGPVSGPVSASAHLPSFASAGSARPVELSRPEPLAAVLAPALAVEAPGDAVELALTSGDDRLVVSYDGELLAVGHHRAAGPPSHRSRRSGRPDGPVDRVGLTLTGTHLVGWGHEDGPLGRARPGRPAPTGSRPATRSGWPASPAEGGRAARLRPGRAARPAAGHERRRVAVRRGRRGAADGDLGGPGLLRHRPHQRVAPRPGDARADPPQRPVLPPTRPARRVRRPRVPPGARRRPLAARDQHLGRLRHRRPGRERRGDPGRDRRRPAARAATCSTRVPLAAAHDRAAVGRRLGPPPGPHRRRLAGGVRQRPPVLRVRAGAGVRAGPRRAGAARRRRRPPRDRGADPAPGRRRLAGAGQRQPPAVLPGPRPRPARDRHSSTRRTPPTSRGPPSSSTTAGRCSWASTARSTAAGWSATAATARCSSPAPSTDPPPHLPRPRRREGRTAAGQVCRATTAGRRRPRASRSGSTSAWSKTWLMLLPHSAMSSP